MDSLDWIDLKCIGGITGEIYPKKKPEGQDLHDPMLAYALSSFVIWL